MKFTSFTEIPVWQKAHKLVYEDAMVENFFKTLKCEEVYLCECETLEDVMERLHLVVGYRSPNDFEELLVIQENKVLPCWTLLTLSVQQ